MPHTAQNKDILLSELIGFPLPAISDHPQDRTRSSRMLPSAINLRFSDSVVIWAQARQHAMLRRASTGKLYSGSMRNTSTPRNCKRQSRLQCGRQHCRGGASPSSCRNPLPCVAWWGRMSKCAGRIWRLLKFVNVQHNKHRQFRLGW
jgi:hypothetical protein